MNNLLIYKLSLLKTQNFERDFAKSAFTLKVVVSLFLILIVAWTSPAKAQTNRVEVGDRVRVTAPFVDPMDRIKGTISEMSGSVLVLSRQDSLIYISDSLIQTMEVSTGKKRVIGEGLLIGAITGTIIIGAISAILNDACGEVESNCSLNRSNGDAFVSGGKKGLIAGIAAGAIAGFFVKIDHWERTPVRIGLGVSSIPLSYNDHSFEPNISFKFGFGD